MIIPIGVEATANTEISISTETLNLPTGIKVFIEDKENNTFTRLDEVNSEYKITLTEALNGVGRFYLHTSQSALSVNDITLNSISIFKQNASTLKIIGLPQGKSTVSIFNILGKQVMTTSFETNGNKEISLPKLASGVYFTRILTESGKVSKKIILE
nr:T9SS type A sorting domain-containing protein [Polaribacter sp. Z022]